MMTEQEERAAVLREAESWIGTPFKWEAAVKGVGVDCGRFLACVFNNAGLRQIDLRALPHLSPQWFLHKSDESFLNVIRQCGAAEYELQPGEQPQPGDVVVAKQGRDFAHSAIVVAWPTVIGAAYEHVVCKWPNLYTSPQFRDRELKFFSPWRNR